MISPRKALSSSVGRKYLMALSGLGLVAFAIVHLAGNLLLYKKDGALFNAYDAKLQSFGPLLTIAELGLLAVFILHIVTAIDIKIKNNKARPIQYSMIETKGGPSRNNISSRHMIITGSILLAFLIWHLWQFRFAGAATNPQMKENLYEIVLVTFRNPVYVALYMAVMIMLGLHLRHGFWSAFQSAGAMNPKIDRPLKILGYVIAILLALGFLGIPIWLYMSVPGGFQ